MKITAIVLAAGSGKRMGTAVKKQYLDLGGHPILFYSLKAFEDSRIDEIVLVTAKEDIDDVKATYMNGSFPKIKKVIEGGKERYNSVYEGLKVSGDSDYVFIHDGARPFVDSQIIDRCVDNVQTYKACVAAVQSKDTVKIADEDGFIKTTPDRRLVWNIQTPQCFEYSLIYEAYNKLIDAEKSNSLNGLNVTDDAMVAEHFGNVRVKLVEGSYNNIKITTVEDLPLAQKILGI